MNTGPDIGLSLLIFLSTAARDGVKYQNSELPSIMIPRKLNIPTGYLQDNELLKHILQL